MPEAFLGLITHQLLVANQHWVGRAPTFRLTDREFSGIGLVARHLLSPANVRPPVRPI